MFSSSLEHAAVETLAYSDIFEHPLTFDELHRYLTVPAAQADLLNDLKTSPVISFSGGYYFLPGQEALISIRRERERYSLPAFRRSLRYGRILGKLPFVRMAALTGSLAMLNLTQHADMDYMLITTTGRLWLARAFAVTFGRLLRLFGDRICVNVLISDTNLKWSVQDLYTAREMCQMIPITGMDAYWKLRTENSWTTSFLPNATAAPVLVPVCKETSSWMQALFEFLLGGRLGDMLERRLMDFQLRKIIKTYGTGVEANFSPNICQGNFHGHRTGTGTSFQKRLSALSEGE